MNAIIANPKDTSTYMSSLNLLNTTPTTMATIPARSTLTGSAAKNGHPKVGIASVRSCSYAGSDVSIAMA